MKSCSQRVRAADHHFACLLDGLRPPRVRLTAVEVTPILHFRDNSARPISPFSRFPGSLTASANRLQFLAVFAVKDTSAGGLLTSSAPSSPPSSTPSLALTFPRTNAVAGVCPNGKSETRHRVPVDRPTRQRRDATMTAPFNLEDGANDQYIRLSTSDAVECFLQRPRPSGEVAVVTVDHACVGVAEQFSDLCVRDPLCERVGCKAVSVAADHRSPV